VKPFTRKSLSAQLVVVVSVSTAPGVVAPAYAGLPVIDSSNLSQNIVTAAENVAQTLKQIQQYQTQLQQYENMLRNTTAPAQNIWDAATTTMNRLRGSIDTLSYYKTNLGSIDAYLGKFKDTAAYRGSPCYSVSGCTPDQWAALKNAEIYGSESQKKSTDALFKGLDLQQDNLQSDAIQLQRLQVSAQGADGQLQAIGYANQLASQQSNQLLQIRGLLIAQQNALATRNQALADNEAKQEAASDKHFAVPGPSNRANDMGF
jgi:P-type conjugative transfer protein TrbJ